MDERITSTNKYANRGKMKREKRKKEEEAEEGR
jgi:hypothetical protein